MKYSFETIKNEINGRVHFSPRIIVEEPHSLLCDLTYVGGEHGGYEGVVNIIKNLRTLQNKDVYYWGSHIIDIESDINNSKLTDIELINKWEIPTKCLIELLENWKQFLEINGFV